MSNPGLARDLISGVPVFPESMPVFEPAGAPASPIDLFLDWLTAAVDSGVLAPHAVNLATVDDDGAPDARVVILKDVSASGWSVASSSDSPKGRQLAARPVAALTFFWPDSGRQVRVRGTVSPAGTEENDADFQRRHPAARALVLAGHQSGRMQDREELDAAVADQLELIDRHGSLGSPDWTVFTVAPNAVEFWQADPERRHTRLLYTRFGDGWRTDLLWP
ncbi:pyridoxal 5'-phosphate synthase [Arthrobacter sp. Br18]|uniref:pyridoxine/pyridoxamine 5'-phosphate oxidase n=1 Tax=Arthrobacter sp. Br18 TaxID=1312954 RepID=UPI00047B92F8|nr:pyridoxal 5'-phosphate synthase [Arthrobacter sp. Br18]